ncbi:hypothetical protein F5148DRAFT_275688 [Russula earlei]|uniref:Uncharacterized protein n=1 Tax=Russula earlei TaxID=71964 RepID=A0ACC0U2N4_9AGAM|nr:hypothetical protein F5148DRAFT_275688 [Russula earlei]
MGNSCSAADAFPSPPAPPAALRVSPASVPSGVVMEESSRPFTQKGSRKSSRNEQTSRREKSSDEPAFRKRVGSAPAHAQLSKLSSSRDPRSRAKSATVPMESHRSDYRPPVPELPKIGARVSGLSYPKPPLPSTLRQVLPDDLRFRILVVGKRGSGKSSLISTVFKVDTSALQQITSDKRDINLEVCPEDNRYLIVHEYTGFEEPDDAQDLQSIQDFISLRTDSSCSASERLHAVWICVPTSDAINGSIGEGVEVILGMRGVAVLVAFAKFDLVVSPEGCSESARARAYAHLEESSRSLFRREPKDIPAEIVSVNPQFRELIGNLVVTTDRFITGSRVSSNLYPRSRVQGTNSRIVPAPLVWSIALRVSRDIAIQASIEVGRSQYWSRLRFSEDFADQPLKNCVNVIHMDIVEIWNLNDRVRYLSSNKFKGRMSYVVKDLAESAGGASLGTHDPTGSGDKFAEWVF